MTCETEESKQTIAADLGKYGQ